MPFTSPPDALSHAFMRHWVMFQNIADPELWCAVPSQRTVPDFLSSSDWCGRSGGGDGNPTRAVRTGCYAIRVDGIYLFHSRETEIGRAVAAVGAGLGPSGAE